MMEKDKKSSSILSLGRLVAGGKKHIGGRHLGGGRREIERSGQTRESGNLLLRNSFDCSNLRGSTTSQIFEELKIFRVRLVAS